MIAKLTKKNIFQCDCCLPVSYGHLHPGELWVRRRVWRQRCHKCFVCSAMRKNWCLRSNGDLWGRIDIFNAASNNENNHRSKHSRNRCFVIPILQCQLAYLFTVTRSSGSTQLPKTRGDSACITIEDEKALCSVSDEHSGAAKAKYITTILQWGRCRLVVVFAWVEVCCT